LFGYRFCDIIMTDSALVDSWWFDACCAPRLY
jgi:hypothetical protein